MMSAYTKVRLTYDFKKAFFIYLTASACSKVLKEALLFLLLILLMPWNQVQKILQIEQKNFQSQQNIFANKILSKSNKKCSRMKTDPYLGNSDLAFPFGIYCGIVWPYNCLLWPFHGLLIAKYQFHWTCIALSRVHRSKFICSYSGYQGSNESVPDIV